MTDISAPLRGPLRKRESKIWAREVNDWYCEPGWCSRRLFEQEQFEGGILDPACGGGNIVRSAWSLDIHAVGTDLVERADGFMHSLDFLADDYPVEICSIAAGGECANIVSKPPFGVAELFVRKALAVADRKVAMLLPANWVQGDKRSRWLQTTPLRRVYFITPRPSMPPGHVIAAGGKPGNGTTDYAWFVWLRGYDGAPEVRWLRRDA
jgi:hypothetical protein